MDVCILCAPFGGTSLKSYDSSYFHGSHFFVCENRNSTKYCGANYEWKICLADYLKLYAFDVRDQISKVDGKAVSFLKIIPGVNSVADIGFLMAVRPR